MRKRNVEPFSLRTEMQKALNWLLEYKRKERRKLEQQKRTNDRWYSEHTYTTATELERRVRAAAYEKLEGKKEGSMGMNHYGGIRIQGLNNTPLLHHCRRFLLDQARAGKLVSHNFGKGHVSGQRFREPGTDLSVSEKKTIAAKKREKPIHLERSLVSKPLCMMHRATKAKRVWRQSRSTTRTTRDLGKVTCTKCRKIIDGWAFDDKLEYRFLNRSFLAKVDGDERWIRIVDIDDYEPADPSVGIMFGGVTMRGEYYPHRMGEAVNVEVTVTDDGKILDEGMKEIGTTDPLYNHEPSQELEQITFHKGE